MFYSSAENEHTNHFAICGASSSDIFWLFWRLFHGFGTLGGWEVLIKSWFCCRPSWQTTFKPFDSILEAKLTDDWPILSIYVLSGLSGRLFHGFGTLGCEVLLQSWFPRRACRQSSLKAFGSVLQAKLPYGWHVRSIGYLFQLLWRLVHAFFTLGCEVLSQNWFHYGALPTRSFKAFGQVLQVQMPYGLPILSIIYLYQMFWRLFDWFGTLGGEVLSQSWFPRRAFRQRSFKAFGSVLQAKLPYGWPRFLIWDLYRLLWRLFHGLYALGCKVLLQRWFHGGVPRQQSFKAFAVDVGP